MSRQEQYDWLRLMWTRGLSFDLAKTLLSAIGLPEMIFSESYSALCQVVPESVARRVCMRIDPEIHERIETALLWVERNPEADLIVMTDSRYPRRLLSIPEPPLAFFTWGDTTYLTIPGVSLVGSTHPNQEGVDLARQWAHKLSESCAVLVEGMSEGIERVALQGMWKQAQAKAILVLDRPMALCDESVVRAMADRHLVVSLVGPYDEIDEPQRWEFRNRLLLGLCSSFVLVQASIRSRSLSFLREALDLNRNVMAIPGSIHSPLSKGSHRLIKDGARLVETIEEVLDEMRVS